jgi:hypothetical protein
MRILRFFLLLASVVGAAYIFRALHAGSVPSAERSIAWLFGLARTGSQYYFSSILRPGRYWNFAVQLHSSSLVQC